MASGRGRVQVSGISRVTHQSERSCNNITESNMESDCQDRREMMEAGHLREERLAVTAWLCVSHCNIGHGCSLVTLVALSVTPVTDIYFSPIPSLIPKVLSVLSPTAFHER